MHVPKHRKGPKYSIHPRTIMKSRERSEQARDEEHLVSGNSVRTSAVSLLGDGELDTLALWQRDPWLLSTDNEDVVLTGGERVVYGVLDVDNVETTIVTLSVSDDTNTTHVTTTSSHGDDTSVELDEIGDLAGSQIDLDSVVDLDGWVWVADTTHAKFRQHFWRGFV